MKIEIRPAKIETLREYGTIPVAFKVRSILQPYPIQGDIGGMELREVDLPKPYVKDYDALEGGRPETWSTQFNLDHWAVFLVPGESGYVAGAVVAFDTPGFIMLEGRRNLAVLWDIRVHPHVRGRGIGTGLFREAVEWARAHGCANLKVETQNTNVPACRFYARQGCELRAVDRFAYAEEPEVAQEIMLLWQKTLA
jgi:ribosomal protein S18 acetylase RimI-like enzyme